jgi:glycosyltransferase involved in cell wall biosynthesis
MPLRVAILCEYPTLNGGERSMLACVDQLAREEVAVTFFAPAVGRLADELQRRSLRHIPFDLHSGSLAGRRDEAALRMVAFLGNFDVLHANSLAMGRWTGAAAHHLTCPSTAHLRDIIKLSPAAVADLNRNSRLIAVSQAVRNFHVAQGADPDRVCVIHNGIDVSVFRRPAACSIRRELGLAESAVLVVAIGQICLRKGQDVFAEAAARILPMFADSHFLLIGSRHSTKPESISFQNSIAARFEQAGLADRYHPLGERDDVPAILAETDYLVHAARQEPFGRVLLEGAAAGVPIIATDVGGTREMLTAGRHAVLVPPNDPQAIADAIAFLASDRQWARQLADAARVHVARQFPIERSARELVNLWRAASDTDA